MLMPVIEAYFVTSRFGDLMPDEFAFILPALVVNHLALRALDLYRNVQLLAVLPRVDNLSSRPNKL
jgi:hypothetical protein